MNRVKQSAIVLFATTAVVAGVGVADASTSVFHKQYSAKHGTVTRSQAHSLTDQFKVYDEFADGWGALGRLSVNGAAYKDYYNGNGNDSVRTWSITANGPAKLYACSIDNGAVLGCTGPAYYTYY